MNAHGVAKCHHTVHLNTWVAHPVQYALYHCTDFNLIIETHHAINIIVNKRKVTALKLPVSQQRHKPLSALSESTQRGTSL